MNRRLWLLVGLVVLLLLVVCFTRPKPELGPTDKTDTWYPDTDEPVMQNVTIEYWDHLHRKVILNAKELRIKR